MSVSQSVSLSVCQSVRRRRSPSPVTESLAESSAVITKLMLVGTIFTSVTGKEAPKTSSLFSLL